MSQQLERIISLKNDYENVQPNISQAENCVKKQFEQQQQTFVAKSKQQIAQKQNQNIQKKKKIVLPSSTFSYQSPAKNKNLGIHKNHIHHHQSHAQIPAFRNQDESQNQRSPLQNLSPPVQNVTRISQKMEISQSLLNTPEKVRNCDLPPYQKIKKTYLFGTFSQPIFKITKEKKFQFQPFNSLKRNQKQAFQKYLQKNGIKQKTKLAKIRRDFQYSRKEKSLGELSKRFLRMFGLKDNCDIEMELVTTQLKVERRRIYDIINILESLGVVYREKKNNYKWCGLKSIKETIENFQKQIQIEKQIVQSQLSGQYTIQTKVAEEYQKLKQELAQKVGKKKKSLGILSTGFIRLFLSWEKVLTLEQAARRLATNIQADQENKIKTKIRRLYDIANVFQALGLIKKTQLENKKPAFRWIGLSGLQKFIEGLSKQPDEVQPFHGLMPFVGGMFQGLNGLSHFGGAGQQIFHCVSQQNQRHSLLQIPHQQLILNTNGYTPRKIEARNAFRSNKSAFKTPKTEKFKKMPSTFKKGISFSDKMINLFQGLCDTSSSKNIEKPPLPVLAVGFKNAQQTMGFQQKNDQNQNPPKGFLFKPVTLRKCQSTPLRSLKSFSQSLSPQQHQNQGFHIHPAQFQKFEHLQNNTTKLQKKKLRKASSQLLNINLMHGTTQSQPQKQSDPHTRLFSLLNNSKTSNSQKWISNTTTIKKSPVTQNEDFLRKRKAAELNQQSISSFHMIQTQPEIQTKQIKQEVGAEVQIKLEEEQPITTKSRLSQGLGLKNIINQLNVKIEQN